MLFLLFVVKKLCDKASVHLHCALGTEFLAAEAADTVTPLYDRLLLFVNNDGFCRANVGTHAAADALIALYNRLSPQNYACDFGEEALYGIFSVTAKLQRAPLDHALKVGENKGVNVAKKLHSVNRFGRHTAQIRGIQNR